MNRGVLCAAVGIVGSGVASLFGGWGAALSGLVLFMAIDFAMGLTVAGVFKRSKKTDGGALESRAGWKGLCRKVYTLALVLVAHWLDIITGTSYIRDAVCIGFIANEAISILENAGLMGIPIPSVMSKAIEVLRDKDVKK
ncbi:phage holin family protein [Oribacterium sp. oral taxon 102]|uniref:phage holin family protein n=1 Tax=Oribacterium sp. oral taxon 102 TaxID=671214 RepID=UPI0015C00019|nr:phage holin family protein [Oribacterium sp. oral taxon 102]NWO21378.1 phage holin family protein [Oribacterium sp. oral taxon 102]